MSRRPEPEIMDFEPGADAYADADFSQVNQAFVDRLLELSGDVDRAEAIDLGTGPADIPIRVVRARPGWHVVAADASGPMVQIARRAVAEAGLSDSIEIVLADAKSTGLPMHAFDVVFSNSILHHVAFTEPFWMEVRRLGRPGGLVFLRDLARPVDEAAARAIVARCAGAESPQLQLDYYNSLLAAYTPEEVRAQLGHAGLEGLSAMMVTDRHMDVYGLLP
jgi:ubiquinone/menaquinone biosynthesis C-methylase UbiE